MTLQTSKIVHDVLMTTIQWRAWAPRNVKIPTSYIPELSFSFFPSPLVEPDKLNAAVAMRTRGPAHPRHRVVKHVSFETQSVVEKHPHETARDHGEWYEVTSAMLARIMWALDSRVVCVFMGRPPKFGSDANFGPNARETMRTFLGENVDARDFSNALVWELTHSRESSGDVEFPTWPQLRERVVYHRHLVK